MITRPAHNIYYLNVPLYFYYFDESMMKFRGRKYKSEISFGQTIEIMVEQVNIQKGFADFILVN